MPLKRLFCPSEQFALSFCLPVPFRLLCLPQDTVYILLNHIVLFHFLFQFAVLLIQFIFLLRKLLILRVQLLEIGQFPTVFCRLQRLNGGFVNDDTALIPSQELFFVLCLFVLRIDRLSLLICRYVFHQKGYVGQTAFQTFQRDGYLFAFRMHFIKNRLQLLIL